MKHIQTKSLISKPNGIHQALSEQPVVGRIAALGNDGEVYVRYPAGSSDPAVPARTVVGLEENDLGREVLLVFENGDPFQPIVTGLLRKATKPSEKKVLQVKSGRERLIIEADQEIVLRCGEAVITLVRDGRVSIRGTSVLSRSSGPNRIKGASVQIN